MLGSFTLFSCLNLFSGFGIQRFKRIASAYLKNTKTNNNTSNQNQTKLKKNNQPTCVYTKPLLPLLSKVFMKLSKEGI